MDEQIHLAGEGDLRQRIEAGQLLQLIRERPALYLGERSLSALWCYLQGFWMALTIHGLRSDYSLPADFHEWVAYRLHFFESTSGYRNMILKRVPDESAALDRFFALLDEHRDRIPRAVARVDRYDREYKRYTVRNGVKENESVERFPSTLTLISYTDDPGFFVVSNDEKVDFPGRGFCPTLESFSVRFRVKKDNVTIIEPDIYKRWLSQEKRFELRD